MSTTQTLRPTVGSYSPAILEVHEPFVAKHRDSLGLTLAALTMVLLKAYCAWTTIGTNDVLQFKLFAQSLRQIGLTQLYHETSFFNHTPLVGAYLRLILADPSDHPDHFAFLLRLPGIIADFALATLLILQRRQSWMAACPTWAITLFILSPVSFMVSGYHGNFDSVMALFLFASTILAVKEKPLTSGVLFGLSLQIKVAPMIVLPVLLIYFGRRHGALGRFLAGVALVCFIGFGVPLAEDPMIFIHNVFGYSGYWGTWGVSYWLRMTGWKPFLLTGMDGHSALQSVVIQILKISVLCGGALLAWRSRKFPAASLFPTLGLAWGGFFVFSPAVAPQYLVWLAPFVLLRDARWFAVLTAGSTLGAFFFYQSISGGLPWYYGQSELIHVPLWTPWMIWTWAACVYGLWTAYLTHRSQRTSR